MPEHILTILSCPEVIKLIGICDEILFKVRYQCTHFLMMLVDLQRRSVDIAKYKVVKYIHRNIICFQAIGSVLIPGVLQPLPAR